MNFQQLKIIRETVRQNYNLTEASQVLKTSQSNVSKHIHDLENELGVQLFIRKGKRLLDLTEAGKTLFPTLERILLDADNMQRIVSEFTHTHQGELVIATTHTQARYILPPIIQKFKQLFPQVHLVIKQTSPKEIVNLLLRGQVDIGIATEALTEQYNLTGTPYYTWQHSIIVPKEHPLLKQKHITLADLVAYPIITYHEGYTGRSKIDQAFQDAHLKPNIILSALDSDIIKTYVELGLGIGIMSHIAYDPTRDTNLTQIKTTLFDLNTTWIAVRKEHILRQYGYHFIHLCSPDANLEALKTSIT